MIMIIPAPTLCSNQWNSPRWRTRPDETRKLRINQAINQSVRKEGRRKEGRKCIQYKVTKQYNAYNAMSSRWNECNGNGMEDDRWRIGTMKLDSNSDMRKKKKKKTMNKERKKLSKVMSNIDWLMDELSRRERIGFSDKKKKQQRGESQYREYVKTRIWKANKSE